jgi:stress response protein SCP2
MQIDKGRRIKLSDLFSGETPGATRFEAELAATGPGLAIDFVCFGLDAAGKLADDNYMTFFNQPKTPCGGVTITPGAANTASVALDLARLPAAIDRLVLTAAIDGAGSMGQLSAGQVRIARNGQEAGKFSFTGADFNAERALMLAEIYRKDGAWRFGATGQGFNGGLDALVQHFGAAVAPPAPSAPVAAPAVPPSVDFTKRLNLEKRVAAEAPQLVNLVKKATISLEKVGLGAHRAKVCLVLDISGSMGSLYSRGLVQAFAERVLALGCRFDDDGEIDVFLFGRNVHQPAAMNLANCSSYVKKITQLHPLEGDTRYGAAIEAVRKFYFPQNGGSEKPPAITAGDTPVYVMFVTDGGTSDAAFTEKQVRASSYEPIFWQFMGIGKGRKSKSKRLLSFADSDFPFLEKLDDLPSRFVDNADFFSVASPDEYPDDALYDKMMTEYPDWLKQARQKGLLR